MKRFSVLSILTLVMGFVSVQPAHADLDRQHTLKVYNWADYIDEDLISEFEEWYQQKTGEQVQVLYQTFDINEIMLTKIETGHEDYDVVCPSEYIIERMLKNDLLLPLDRNFGSTPDFTANVAPYARQQFATISAGGRNANDYAVPYMWGTTGIMYNTDFMSREEAETWGILWNPKYQGRILMKDAVRDMYGSIMMYVRQSELTAGTVDRPTIMNDMSDASLKLFEDTMTAAKRNILGWEVDFGKERMAQGKAWVNVTWSGDAMWAMEEVADKVSLDYVVPKEGSNVWFDGWVIPRYAVNTKAANWFINFMCASDNAVRNMEAIGYVSAIGTPDILKYKTDTKYAPIDLRYFFGDDAGSVCVSPVQYPDAGTIERCALMHDCGSRTEAVLDMWSRVKGNSLNLSTILVISVIAAGAIAFGVIKAVSNKRKSKRRSSSKKGTQRH